MKLLIITQRIDRSDPVLGFFHRWLEEFHKYFGPLTVICLGRGQSSLSSEIKILSLGKEESLSRVQYIWRLFSYLWQERNNYDTVFVHMNQEYVILAGWWWRLTGKRVLLWRNHPQGDFLTRVAVFLVHRVFCTSPFSFTARFKKTRLMPAGIDTNFFAPHPEVSREARSILFLGRIAPIKRVENLLTALIVLNKRGVDFSVEIIGDPLEKDLDYYRGLRCLVNENNLQGRVVFKSGIPNDQTIEAYSRASVYVNLTPSGSFDKTILEAMACGTLTAVSNESFNGAIPGLLIVDANNAEKLADTLEHLLTLNQVQYQTISDALMQYVEQNHSLAKLAMVLRAEAGQNS